MCMVLQQYILLKIRLLLSILKILAVITNLLLNQYVQPIHHKLLAGILGAAFVLQKSMLTTMSATPWECLRRP